MGVNNFHKPDTGSEIKIPRSALVVHCLIEGHASHWEAHSLEFGLSAQAESMEEAKRKLNAMISSYLFDALVGEDQAYAEELLNRRATFKTYIRYYTIIVTNLLRRLTQRDNDKDHEIYRNPVPLAPVGC